eukprot:NODE_280_length_10841_cov_1.006982.p1 type:complete len:467 gc:universal NODE_280_length_10841_cov_1.006982:9915-8515(-)
MLKQMFLKIFAAIFIAILSYIIYIVIIQRFLYFRMKIPYVKPDEPGILGYLLGNSKKFNDLEIRHQVMQHWKSQVNSDIFGIISLFRPMAVVFDKELIHLLATEPYFHKTTELKIILEDVADGLLLQEDQQHANARKLYLPIFTTGNIQKMFPTFVEMAQQLADKLSGLNQPCSPMPEIQKCTLDIISKVAFNYDLNALHKTSAVSKAFEEILSNLKFTIFLVLKLAFPILHYLPLKTNLETQNHKLIVKKCVDDMIQHRIQNPSKDVDLLSKILGNASDLNLQDLRRQILTFMSAGHETTAVALSWSFYCLAQHPQVQDKLRKSISEISWDQVQNNEYLDKVCNEVLRLYAPAALIIRRTTKPFIFKDVYYPKNMRFVVPIQDLHFNVNEPLEFDPDRSIDSQDYMPFWMGHRGCIGKQLAMVEFKTLLAYLVKHLEFKMKDGHVKRVSQLTQRPSQFQMTINKL